MDRADSLLVHLAQRLADNDLPPRRRGANAAPHLFVVHAADRGMLTSGYQASGLHTPDIPETARWLT